MLDISLFLLAIAALHLHKVTPSSLLPCHSVINVTFFFVLHMFVLLVLLFLKILIPSDDLFHLFSTSLPDLYLHDKFLEELTASEINLIQLFQILFERCFVILFQVLGYFISNLLRDQNLLYLSVLFSIFHL